jgi:sulfur-oxidizing protein SoxZ
MARALVNVPATARRGSIVEIKALVAHPMETGFRVDDAGAAIPRNIITRLVCTYRGEEIFSADLFPAMTANPFVAFSTVATESGEIVFTWTGDNGFEQTETATIAVA